MMPSHVNRSPTTLPSPAGYFTCLAVAPAHAPHPMRYGQPKAGDVTAGGNHIAYYAPGMTTARA
eukprot:3635770-Prorocentrum_lima.AAC.1